VRAKFKEQAAARRLRAKGLSLREISRELGVSLSSVSVWTRGIKGPPPATPEAVVPREGPTRACGGCGRTLDTAQFHRGQSRCKDCRQEYMRERGDLHRKQSRRARDKRRAIARAYVLDLLRTNVCTDCGLADPAVLEFDHVGPKRMEVGKMVREAYRLSRIKAEIENCELVCANCHRRRTAVRARAWRVEPKWKAERATRPLRRRNFLFLLEHLKNAHCVDCGQSDPVVLDFDHVGVKRRGVVQLADRESSIASLKREIAECQVRCANCHRRRTIVQQRHFRNHLIAPP
jgi:transcriptional regulator with XRE-family HTH domain